MAGSNPDLVVTVAANITSLQTNMAAAAASIKDLQGSVAGASAATTELSSIFNGMNIQGAFTNPMSEASTLLKNVASGAGAGTVELVAFGAGAVAAGAAIFKLGDEAAKTGEEMLTFSRLTGLSAADVDRVKYAADIAGSSLDQMQGMAFMLEKQMLQTGAAGDKFNKGLVDLRINADEFRNAKFPEQLVMLSEGMRQGAISGNNMAAGLEVMGMRGRQYIPVLMKDFKDLTEEADKFGLHLTDQDLLATEKFNEGLRSLDETVKNVKTSIGMIIVEDLNLYGSTIRGLIADFDKFKADNADTWDVIKRAALGAIDAVNPQLGALIHTTQAYGDATNTVAMDVQMAAVGQDRINQAYTDGEIGPKRLADAVKILADRDREAKTATQDAADQLERWNKAVIELDASEAAQQIAEEAQAAKDMGDQLERWNKAVQDLNASEAKEAADQEKRIDDEVEAFRRLGDAKRTAGQDDGGSGDSGGGGGGGYGGGDGGGGGGGGGSTKQPVESYSADFTTSQARAKLAASNPRLFALLSAGYSLAQAIVADEAASFGQLAPPLAQGEIGPRVPGFMYGSGGIQDFGAGTLAMLHGREAVVPEGSGGGNVSITIVVNGSVLSNPHELAAVVGDALTQRLRSLGMRLPGNN